MLESLFTRCGALARHHQAPLLEERERYLAHLAAQGWPRITLYTLAHHLRVVASELDFTRRRRITLPEIRTAATRWARRQVARGRAARRWYSRRYFERTARKWLAFLNRLELPRPATLPGESFVGEYARWMQHECGFSTSTIYHRRWSLHRFFAWFLGRNRSFKRVSLCDIDKYVAHESRYWSRRTLAPKIGVLKSFFKFAESRGWCGPGIAEAIESPRIYTHENIPLGPNWDEVKRLVNAPDSGSPTDIRNRALLRLLATYGLRRGEVAILRLDDFDWENELLRVRRPKQGCTQTYPLARTVGNAVIEYLKKVRPRCSRSEVFLSLNSPPRAMSSGAVGSAVRNRMIALRIRSPRMGPHALRHACATRLVSQELTYKEIGDHLGHRSPISTRVYAKVDLAGLRRVAALDLGGLA